MTDTDQERRTFLRERFLRVLSQLTNKQAQFDLTIKQSVIGTFGGADIDVLQFYVKNLQTPIGTQSHALIRATDVACITFQNVDQEKE